MVDNDSPGKGRKQRKGRSTNALVYVLLILAIAGGIYLYLLYLEKSPVPPSGQQAVSDTVSSPDDGAVPPSTPPPPETDAAGADQGIIPAGTEADSSTGSSLPAQTTGQDGMPEELGPNGAADENQSCSARLKTITDFYRHLDQQEYLEPYQLGQPAELYISTLIQKVADNPPIVTGETDDLFNILKNTAHFFRIFGKKNIFVLKAILDREKDSL